MPTSATTAYVNSGAANLSTLMDERSLILVVDDNAQNRALVQATLEDDGYRVLLASDGEQALRAFDVQRPSCVLLDIRMPGMNGIEVCREIRARAVGGDTPVVFLTAVRDVQTFDEALEVGGDDFLTKPVRPTELLVRVQAALKLQRLTAENRDHYATIRSQRDAMMRLQLQKEQLMTFVVHDLKNPVGALDLHAQLLLRDASLSARSRESARAIREEAGRLLRQIRNLLDLSQSDEAGLATAPGTVDVPALVAEVQGSFELRAHAQQVAIAVQVAPAHVYADGDLLRRVLENLLDNALRHAPRDSRVVISSQQRGERLILTITDQGPGIPIEMRESIFERFVQAGDGRSARGGYGLGLAFCKLALEHQDGRIWVEERGPGATFSMSLRHVR